MAFPIIAAINGFALGGGCEMAISADFRLMSRTAKIGVPEVKLGAIPGAGGVQKLGRHIGRTRAIEWVLLGKHYTAVEEARAAGLLYEVTEPDDAAARRPGPGREAEGVEPARHRPGQVGGLHRRGCRSGDGTAHGAGGAGVAGGLGGLG